MAMRLFIELASRLTNHRNDTEIIEVPVTDDGEIFPATYYHGAAKFHIGMLTISLLVGLAYGGYVAYCNWMTKDTILGYIRNLVFSIVCRSFFSILFDGVILLGSINNVGGGNALLAFEQIFRGLTLAFWLTLTIYLHARVQRDFNSEPTLKLYQYGVPGVAVFFSFVWIFTLQDQHPNFPWWLVESVQLYSKWIASGAYLLLILIQLGLVVDIVRMMMTKKSSLDNDSVSLFSLAGIMMGALVLIFWLQFGLVLGRVPFRNPSSYIYFDYFIDGLEGTLICICLFFFVKWVSTLIKTMPRTLSATQPTTTTEIQTEESLPGGRGIVTVDSVFVSRESGRFNTSQEVGSTDVVYSNVVEPERLKKTLELYNRFDFLPRKKGTVVEGEEFFDCIMPSSLESSKQSISNEEIKTFKAQKSLEQTQKKNAFYSSKYLILDPKEEDIPKYLETRPSVSSMSGTPKEERVNLPDIPGFEINEIVTKWLNRNSEDMPNSNKTKLETRGSIEEEKNIKDFEVKIPTPDGKHDGVPETHSKEITPLNESRKDGETPKRKEIPDIVIEADPQSPEPQTAEELKKSDEIEKILISTIASKLEEKIGLGSSSSTEEKLTPSGEESKPSQDTFDTSQQHQQQHPTTAGRYLSHSELLEFHINQNPTSNSVSKSSSETSESDFSEIKSNEIMNKLQGNSEKEKSHEEEGTSPSKQQQKDVFQQDSAKPGKDENDFRKPQTETPEWSNSQFEINDQPKQIDEGVKKPENLKEEEKVNLPRLQELDKDNVVNTSLNSSAESMKKFDKKESDFHESLDEGEKNFQQPEQKPVTPEPVGEETRDENLQPNQRDKIISEKEKDGNPVTDHLAGNDTDSKHPHPENTFDSEETRTPINLQKDKNLKKETTATEETQKSPLQTLSTDSENDNIRSSHPEAKDIEEKETESKHQNSQSDISRDIQMKDDSIGVDTEEKNRQPEHALRMHLNEDRTTNDRQEKNPEGQENLKESEPKIPQRFETNSTTEILPPTSTETAPPVQIAQPVVPQTLFDPSQSSHIGDEPPSTTTLSEPTKTFPPVSTETMTKQTEQEVDLEKISSDSTKLNTNDRPYDVRPNVLEKQSKVEQSIQANLRGSKEIILRPNIFQKIETEPPESSDSEFSIEGRKTSGESFSLEDYYKQVTAAKNNITTRQNPLRFIQSAKN